MVDAGFVYFKCIEVRQPIGTLYVGAMNFNQVTFISYADVRRIEDRDVERYIGIQRPLEDKRVKELRNYVRTIDSSFPTSIILAVKGEDAEYDPENGIMRITKNTEVAKIIDGQHRIAGLLNYDGPPFQLNVTIFIDMDIEDQALLFATINLKQTKVNKSLAYDLFEFAASRSPQKTCHNIAKLLNNRDGSPLRYRIKILGRATGRHLENLTQATVVERLIKYISTNPMKDRDLIKRRQPLDRASRYEETEGNLIFRNMFIDDRDEDIALVVWNLLTAAAKRWSTAWNTEQPGFILNRTTGFAALMRILPDIYVDLDAVGSVPSVETFSTYFAEAKLADADLNKDTFVPGTSGETFLYNTLANQMGLTGRKTSQSR
ncbi:MAG: DGQHR domain-containing protein [Terriglobales bacterium]